MAAILFKMEQNWKTEHNTTIGMPYGFGIPASLYLSYVLPEGHQSTQRNPDQLVEPGQTRPTLSQNYNKMTKHFLHHFWQGQTWRFGQSGMAVRRPGPRQRAARGGTAESGGWLYLRLFCREDRGTRSCRCRNSGDDGFEFADDPSQRCRRKMFSSWNNFIWMCSKELKNGTLNKGKILILGCYDIKVLDIEVPEKIILRSWQHWGPPITTVRARIPNIRIPNPFEIRTFLCSDLEW